MLFYFNAIKGKPFLLLLYSLHKHKQLSSQPLKLTEIQRKKIAVVMKLILNSRLLNIMHVTGAKHNIKAITQKPPNVTPLTQQCEIRNRHK